jgi:hypothetical protein
MIKKLFIGICVAIAANSKLMTKSGVNQPNTNTIGNVLSTAPLSFTGVTGGAGAASKTMVNTSNNAVTNTLNLNGNNPNADIKIDNNLLSNIHSTYTAPIVKHPGSGHPPKDEHRPGQVGTPGKPNKKCKHDW